MKWLVALLALLNAAFFGYTRLIPAASTTVVLAPEVNAGQVRIADTTVEASTPPAPAPAASAVAAAPPAAAAEPAAAPAAACLRWRVPSQDQAQIADARIRALSLDVQVLQSAEQAKVWVYIPPQTDLEAARKKAAELQTLGVEDYFVVNNAGRWQNAVSLGVYSTREAAERRLAGLRAQGVQSAVLRERDDTLRPASYLLRNVNDSQLAALKRANGQLRGAELSEVPCR
ncbi:SPOR domain-containing protein [Chitiniphilus purpureus]|uniref:SPOR domain-containing protein n=1 Tax=Chitiniphilus purpureus TaxID=2981137 RepID=A0ABY6DLS3_9NEIS|nr:SPOR domain-containing protein [Chitiniphilus sp. CD1]UXY15320.1 SPOR domain-containing protein [Chitiniphilus sp. CD1]